MINTANTLGASAPGFTRSNTAERKPDAGSQVAESKPKENLQSARVLEGGQELSDSRQTLRNETIPSATPTDQSDNETRRVLDERAVNRSGEPGAKRENRESVTLDISERAHEKAQRAEHRDSNAANEAQQPKDKPIAPPESTKEVSVSATAPEHDQEVEANASSHSASAMASPSQEATVSAPRGSDKSSESENNNKNQASRVENDLVLSRPEQEGLRSFQQVAEVSAFDATGTNIDVSV